MKNNHWPGSMKGNYYLYKWKCHSIELKKIKTPWKDLILSMISLHPTWKIWNPEYYSHRLEDMQTNALQVEYPSLHYQGLPVDHHGAFQKCPKLQPFFDQPRGTWEVLGILTRSLQSLWKNGGENSSILGTLTFRMLFLGFCQGCLLFRSRC